MYPELEIEKHIIDLEKKIAAAKEKHPDDEKNLSLLNSKLKAEIDLVYSDLNPWQITQIARHVRRPTFFDYINLMFTDFIEIHGDRGVADDLAIVCGMAKIDNEKVFLIGQQRGKSLEEAKKRNFGMPNPEGYRKALRVMKIAEKFNRPILTFIDTPGAYPGMIAEERGQGEAIARNLKEMSKLKVPVIATVIGEGGSGGALGIGVANTVFMLSYSIYSVISPEGCASILFRDAKKAEEAAKCLKLTSKDLLELKIIDDIIEEPKGGAHRFPDLTAANIKAKLLENLSFLKKMSRNKIAEKRIEKFLRMGKLTDKVAAAE